MKADQEDFIINDKRELLEFFRILEDRFDKNGKQFATIKNDNTTKLGSLQRLYWHFVGQIIEVTGQTKDEQHYWFKYGFLIAIFARNPQEHPEHENVIENMADIKQHKPEMFNQLRDMVILGTHHKKANEAEIREFIRLVEDKGINLGVKFKLNKNQKELWGEK